VELTAVELWSRIQDAIRGSVADHAFHTWIEPARAVSSSADELVLEAQNPFHVEWLEDKFADVLVAAGTQVLGRPMRLTVQAATSADPGAMTSIRLGAPDMVPAPASPSSPAIQRVDATRATPAPRPALNERYTFDRFIVGTNNQLAEAASKAVADKPAKMYNPLFLYGGVGLGKTHLMHAVGNHVLARDPHVRIAYVSSEQFMNELVSAIRQGTTPEFRARYREMDVLLVDDVHFLGGKESTQEEFFHTFNALYDAQRQIVLTSDRPPKEMAKLEERLVSRFEWGLVVDMQPPDFETRMAILRRKAEDEGLTIDDDVIEFVAHACTASVRELEGAVIKLLAYSSLTHREITSDLARTLLRGVLSRRGKDVGPVLSPERIRETVARRWRVRPDALASKRRTRDLTVPRQVAMYLIKETLGMSLSRIGDVFGGRDHSTVIHSIRKVEEDMERDPTFRSLVEAARDELQAEDGSSNF
jgi:chromosomal replication initiator protein